MIVRIDPPLPLMTPRGKGLAHFLIDNGVETHLQWVVFQDDTGEVWTYRTPTCGRKRISRWGGLCRRINDVVNDCRRLDVLRIAVTIAVDADTGN